MKPFFWLRFWLRLIPADRVGMCCCCRRILGEVDGTERTAICEACSRITHFLTELQIKQGWMLRDALGTLAGNLRDQGSSSMSVTLPCGCGHIWGAAATVPGLYHTRDEMVERLCGMVPYTCPRCGQTFAPEGRPFTVREVVRDESG